MYDLLLVQFLQGPLINEAAVKKVGVYFCVFLFVRGKCDDTEMRMSTQIELLRTCIAGGITGSRCYIKGLLII